MTLPIDLYPWFALGSSLLLLGAFGEHLRTVIEERPRVRPDVAAMHTLMAVVLVVVGVGLFIASAEAFNHTGLGVNLRIIGLSLVRGALLVGALVILRTDSRGHR